MIPYFDDTHKSCIDNKNFKQIVANIKHVIITLALPFYLIKKHYKIESVKIRECTLFLTICFIVSILTFLNYSFTGSTKSLVPNSLSIIKRP